MLSDIKFMPKFLDVHPMKGFTEESLMTLQKSPRDEDGLLHENTLFNPEIDRVYCLLDAPTLEAVKKHHAKFGVTCEWITEVRTAA